MQRIVGKERRDWVREMYIYINRERKIERQWEGERDRGIERRKNKQREKEKVKE